MTPTHRIYFGSALAYFLILFPVWVFLACSGVPRWTCNSLPGAVYDVCIKVNPVLYRLVWRIRRERRQSTRTERFPLVVRSVFSCVYVLFVCDSFVLMLRCVWIHTADRFHTRAHLSCSDSECKLQEMGKNPNPASTNRTRPSYCQEPNPKVNEKALGETQTLCAGCSKAEPKKFAPPQTPFPGAQTAKI